MVYIVVVIALAIVGIAVLAAELAQPENAVFPLFGR